MKNIYQRLFFIAVFLSAFLLFLIQPMLAKFLLPTFGGSASVWAVSLVFYQVLLLLGYAYAHVAQKIDKKKQVIMHGLLLLASLAFLPLVPKTMWFNAHEAAGSLLLILTLTAGLPYFILASTSPLLQSWAASFLGDDSYRLYGYSNLGSFLGLLAYPFVFEPLLPLPAQSWVWSILFVGCLALIFWISTRAKKTEAQKPEMGQPLPTQSRFAQLGWFFLPFISTILLVSISVRIATDVAPVPMLWVLPLLIYLATYVIAFEFREWYYRSFFLVLFACSAAFYSFLMVNDQTGPLSTEIGIPAIVLFSACMLLHGELFRLRPHTQTLTRYYLLLSAGGAGGGLFAGLIAPELFNSTYEFWLALGATTIFGLVLLISGEGLISWRHSKRRAIAITLASVMIISAFALDGLLNREAPVFQVRNFYGIAMVFDRETSSGAPYRSLRNGSTMHGLQYIDEALRCRPTSYYSYDSGAGKAWQALQTDAPMNVGVVGLGTGTMKAYAREQDSVRFYEIDPKIIPIAEEQFTFLDCAGAHAIVLGDARTSLEAEESHSFDLLVLDAFSSDAIPTHLLTREAFAVYARHMAENGILAVHISNRYLDLLPVVVAGAQSQNFAWLEVNTSLEEDALDSASTWVLLSKKFATLEAKGLREGNENQREVQPIAWTDQFSNVLEIINW